MWQTEWGAPVMFSHGLSTNECGVAVMLPRVLLSICDVKMLYSDEVGRIIILELQFRLFKLILCAVYALTQGHVKQQVDFIGKLKEEIDQLVDGDSYLIVCGDFNLHLSALDTQNRFRLTQAANRMLELAEKWHLVDVWRDHYKTKRPYTWRRFNPSQQSRIDYVLASEHLVRRHILKRIEIKPGIDSDHSLVNVEMTVHGNDKGRGLFRFENTLLDDSEFVDCAKAEIEKARNEEGIYENVSDIGIKIEMLSSEIRVHSIRIQAKRTRKRKESEQILRDKLDLLEKEVGRNPNEAIIKEYEEVKTKLNNEEEKRGKVAMLHSGARWLELGEKPTKYFFRVNENRKKEKDIHVLQRSDGEYVTGNNDILKYCREHYEKLYTSQAYGSQRGSQVTSFLQPGACPKLSEVDKGRCEGAISREECEQAFKAMMNNKAASVSGLTKEFFIFFWSELGDMVVEYVNKARQDGVFFVTQRRGVITVLPKKGEQKLIKNKRAICLLDVIYKIVAEVIANRLMSAIHVLVAPDQTGSIRGRYIGTNLRTIADVIHYCNSDELEGIIMALDFKNAFNTVELKFVYDVLRECNFGDNFISWVQLLHSETELCIINNGYTSKWFKPSRGFQQGCPASAPLFALVVEILAIKIRETIAVQGIEVTGITFKVSQYCDDTTLFVKDSESAEHALDLVREFGHISGLQLNIDKCDVMWLGAKKESKQFVCGLKPADRLKILGVWFSATQNCDHLNIGAV